MVEETRIERTAVEAVNVVDKIEKLLEKPCYVIDVLPKKVPADANGSFFEVEAYFEDNYGQYQFQKKFVDIILKLMCYYPVSVFSYDAGRLIESPPPRVVVDLVRNNKSSLGILLGRNTLFMLEKRCLNMAVYNPDYDMREMISRIIGAEGLFWRESGG